MAYHRRRRGRNNNNKRHPSENFTPKKGPSFFKNNKNVIDFLDEDEPIRDQELCLIAYLTMGENQQNEIMDTISKRLDKPIDDVRTIIKQWVDMENPMRAVKIRGVWPNNERAHKQMKEKIDQYRNGKEDWHTFCAEVGKWCPFDPKPELIDRIDGQDYYEKELNNLMKGRRLTQMKSKAYFEERKKQMLERAILEGTEEGQQMMNEQEEPLEAVEFRIKSANEAKEEFLAKIEEAEQAKIAAEKKLEYMKEQMAKGKVYPKLDDNNDDDDNDDNDDKATELSDEVLQKRNEIESKMKELRPIDDSRLSPEEKTKERYEKKKERYKKNIFESENILPHEQRENMKIV